MNWSTKKRSIKISRTKWIRHLQNWLDIRSYNYNGAFSSQFLSRQKKYYTIQFIKKEPSYIHIYCYSTLKKNDMENTREIKKMSNKQPTYLYTIPTITTTTKDYYYNMTIPT